MILLGLHNDGLYLSEANIKSGLIFCKHNCVDFSLRFKLGKYLNDLLINNLCCVVMITNANIF